MGIHEELHAATEAPMAIEPQAEAEPVRLVDGRPVLSPERRAYWLAPEMLPSEADLDLALIEVAGQVQPRGAHSLLVQVERGLARIARDRRDRDRRYQQARASGGQGSGRSTPGTVPGHRPRGGETRSVRSMPVDLGGGRRSCGEHDRDQPDLDAPRWYALTSPEGQAYRAHWRPRASTSTSRASTARVGPSSAPARSGNCWPRGTFTRHGPG
jgi:hypothetical protein